MRTSRSIAVLVVALALSACGSTTTPANTLDEPMDSTTSTPPADTTPDTAPTTTPGTTDTTETVDVSALVDRDWVVDGMITIAGIQPVPKGSTAALRFTDDGDGTGTGTVEVDTGCNTGSATVSFTTANELTVGPVALTKMACTDELNAVEASLVGQLENPLSWGVDGDTLTLVPTNVSDSGLQLHDAAAATPTTTIPPSSVPGGPSDDDMKRLLGTEWIPERFITVGPLDPIPANSGASVRFDDADTIAINTGCNQGAGTVSFAADGTFTVSDLEMTDMACDDNGLEVRILAQLEHTLQWGIDADTLTIYPIDVSDTGLILRDAAVVAAEPTTTMSVEDSAAADRAAVLAAAAVARSQSEPIDATEIAIVETLGTSAAGGMVVFGPDDPAITDAERDAVEAALAPSTIRWVADMNEPALKAATAAGQVGAVITLSNPAVEGDAATIVTGLYVVYPGGGSQGGGVTVDRQPDGTWQVGDPFGAQWIS